MAIHENLGNRRKQVALVAGGAGFIGSHLCDYLMKSDYHVIAVDNLVTGRIKNISHLFNNPQFSFIEHDIIQPLKLNYPIDEIYNLASPASPTSFDLMPEFILKTNSIGHQNMLDLARQKNSKILFASTSEIYGDPLVHPQPENYFGHVNSVGKRACYAEGKRFGEALTTVYKDYFNVSTRIARIFNVYGERMSLEDGRIIPNFFKQALKRKPLKIYGSGEYIRCFCHVDDMVKGIYLLMQSQINDPVNLGNTQETSVLAMGKMISEICGVSLSIDHMPFLEGDPKRRRPDITKAREVLNWSPEITLHDGLLRTKNYFSSQDLTL